MESPKRSQLDQLDTKMSVVSSEHRARQAVAAAAQAAQASPNSRFSGSGPQLSPLSPTQPAPAPKRRCRAAQEAFQTLRGFAEKYKLREVFLLVLGLASLVFLLTAVSGPEPQPFAAVVSALLGWLTVYTYMLQAECQRLTTVVQLMQNRGARVRDLEEQRLGAEISGVCNAYELLRPGGSQKAVQSVLTASLVHDYLRLQSALRIYSERYGPLDAGSQWNLDQTLEVSMIQTAALDGSPRDDASQVGELPVRNEVEHSSSAAGPSVAEAISKTIASIEDSMNLPSWLKQIRH